MNRFPFLAWLAPLLALLTLTLVALGAWHSKETLAASVRDYRPVAAVQAARPVPLPTVTSQGESSVHFASPPVAQQVVLVVVSGLRVETFRRMPTLADLAQRSARAEVQVNPPTGRLATWGALLTGAGPEFSGAPLLDPPLTQPHPLAAETLLATARRAGLTAAVFGRGPWESLLPDEKPQGGIPPTGFSMAATTDQATTDATRDAWRTGVVGLSVVGYRLVELAGMQFSPDSPQYERAALTVDGQIALLVKDIDLRRAVLVVTSDRGLTDAGRAGGDESTVTTVPFLAVGVGVKPGEYSRLAQTDIAPTLAAWLGIEPPAQAQGVTRGDMLQVLDGLRAQRGLADAAQKLGLEQALAARLGSDRDIQTVTEEVAGLPVIRTSMDLGNDAGAWKLAESTAHASQQRMARLREQVLSDGVDTRLIPFLLVLAGLLFALAWGIGPRRVILLLAALVAWLLPLGGLSLIVTTPQPLTTQSPTTQPTTTLLGWPIAVLLALTLALAGVLYQLWRMHDPRRRRLAVVGVAALALLAWPLLRPPLPLSISDVAAGVDVGRLAVGQAALSLAWGAVVVLALAWWGEGREGRHGTEGTESGVDVVGMAGEYGLLLAGLLVGQWAMLWWQVGLTVEGFVPGPGLVLHEVVTLARLLPISLGGLVMPWLAVFTHLAATYRPDDLPQPAPVRRPDTVAFREADERGPTRTNI